MVRRSGGGALPMALSDDSPEIISVDDHVIEPAPV